MPGALAHPAAPDKTKTPRMGHFYFILVGAAGFEPTLAESESDVLPLNYAPMHWCILYMEYFLFQLIFVVSIIYLHMIEKSPMIKIMKKLLVNILCGFIPSRNRRVRLRMELNNLDQIRKCVRFVKTFSEKKHPNIKYTYGFRCANFVVTLDNKWVFKFPLHGDAYEISRREQRITDALRPISPIKIPQMEIIDFNGTAVRKYEYIKGIGFHSLSEKVQDKNATKIAKQLANFLYVIGQSDPKEIRDLKSKPYEKPFIMYGWCQNDLWDNFIMNKNFDIIAMIDWEGAGFNDFYSCFSRGTKNSTLRHAILAEYMTLWHKKHSARKKIQ